MKTSGDKKSAFLQLFFIIWKTETDDKERIDGSVSIVKNALEWGLNYHTIFLRGPAVIQMRYYLLSPL